jgi:hypothetical protein
LLQLGGKRPQEEGEVALAEFYCSLEEGVPERVAPAVFGFQQRREFPGEQTVWCLLRRYSKYAEHLRKPYFFGSGGILFTQSTTWVFCSGGNPPPRGNAGLKRTRTDAILRKKIEFKINFK